jgi:DNA-binding winged helix-turn-helix (wHTH) protein
LAKGAGEALGKVQVAGGDGHAVRFGPFVADLRAGELYRDGGRVRLQEQPFKLLAMLVEDAGAVVTRDELRHTLWPEDSLVDFDHRINVAVSKIRAALGRSAGHSFIETVGRRGYRFVQPVQPVSPPTAVHSLPEEFSAPIKRTLCPILDCMTPWFALRASVSKSPGQLSGLPATSSSSSKKHGR